MVVTPQIIVEALGRLNDKHQDRLVHLANVVTVQAADLEDGERTQSRRYYWENSTWSIKHPGTEVKCLAIKFGDPPTLQPEQVTTVVDFCASFLDLEAHFKDPKYKGKSTNRTLRNLSWRGQAMLRSLAPRSQL